MIASVGDELETRNVCVLLVGIYINVVIMENNMEAPFKKLKKNYHMIQKFYFLAYI
jgi:hypothetical protein